MTRPAASLLLSLVLGLALFPVLAASLEECTDCLEEAAPGDCLARCPLCSCGVSRSEPVLGQGSPNPLAVAGRLERTAALCAVGAPVHDVFHVPRIVAA